MIIWSWGIKSDQRFFGIYFKPSRRIFGGNFKSHLQGKLDLLNTKRNIFFRAVTTWPGQTKTTRKRYQRMNDDATETQRIYKMTSQVLWPNRLKRIKTEDSKERHLQTHRRRSWTSSIGQTHRRRPWTSSIGQTHRRRSWTSSIGQTHRRRPWTSSIGQTHRRRSWTPSIGQTHRRRKWQTEGLDQIR